jgi:hypothetical protein
MYINDLTRILDIGLNVNIRCSSNEDNIMEYLENNSFTVLNLCIKVLTTLDPRAIHSVIIINTKKRNKKKKKIKRIEMCIFEIR